MKKEEFIEQNAKLKHEGERLLLQDQLLRKEFAKAFDWYKKKGMYDYEQELRLPTWEEIFIKLGRLLSRDNYSDIFDRVKIIENDLQWIHQHIEKDENV